jgi:hypothetical protein
LRAADAERRARESAWPIFRALRAAAERTPGFSHEDAARVLRGQLCRPGRVGARLPRGRRDEVLDGIPSLAAGVELSDQRALFELCVAVARRAWLTLPEPERSARTPSATVDDTAKLARASLLAEWTRRGDDESTVRRATTRALREKRRSYQGTARVDVREADPLRGLLDLPAEGAVRLPRNDVRVHLTRSRNRDGSPNLLPDLLRRAARFSERALRPALGEELWGLCRPVGFAGRGERLVTVQVDSSSLAHEVSLRKRELIRRLNAVPGFEKVRDVRFVVEDRRSIPVVGGDR